MQGLIPTFIGIIKLLCEFDRKRKIPIWEDTEVFLASPEDVIIKKLDYYRQGGSGKHIKDIRGILAETKVDEEYLQHWITKLNLTQSWQEAKS